MIPKTVVSSDCSGQESVQTKVGQHEGHQGSLHPFINCFGQESVETKVGQHEGHQQASVQIK